MQQGEVYVVGGCLRDEILGRSHKDWDLIVRTIPFRDLVKLLREFGDTNLVGKSFGIIKFRPRDEPSL